MEEGEGAPEVKAEPEPPVSTGKEEVKNSGPAKRRKGPAKELWPEQIKGPDTIGGAGRVGFRPIKGLPSALEPEEEPKKKPKKAEEPQGQPLALQDPEPWPGPVDGATLLDELAATFCRFVVLPPGGPEAAALWVVMAHAHDAAQVSPLLAFSSPEKRCGKTTALAVTGALVPRPLLASNISPAALFRVVERFYPCLLIDEADSFAKRDDELRGVLNSGHTRATAYVVRTVGEDHEPRQFKTWAPKAVAFIGNLWETVEDRSINIRMKRRGPGEVVEPLRLDRLGDLEPLRRKAWGWAQDHLEGLRRADPRDFPPELNDRTRDNWRPLLAIADIAGGSWPAKAREAARLLSGGEVEDGSQGVQLLADLRDIFTARAVDRLTSSDIVAELNSREDRPWFDRKEGPLSKNAMARLLRPFGVRPVKSGDFRGYRLLDLEDAFSRYLPPSPQQPPTRPNQDGAAGRMEEGGRVESAPVHETARPPDSEEGARTNEKGESLTAEALERGE